MAEEVQTLCGQLAAATLQHMEQHMDQAPRDVRYARWVEDAPLGGLWSTWSQVHWTVIEKVARRVGGKA
ncbi:MAG: hypothetical protein OXC13_20190 [Caldilineaceae bacterium]|nr:hypothetical protein [Caldilineaceae bacterium]